MYEVHLSEHADKFISKLETQTAQRITQRLKRLSETPIPTDSKFICREEGEKIFRYRIGDYRALYKVKDDTKIVLIITIDKRPRIYN